MHFRRVVPKGRPSQGGASKVPAMPLRAPRLPEVSLHLETFVVVALLALSAAPAAAETVQYTFVGTIGTVSDGTGGTLDLTKGFAVGQPATIVVTVERSTPGYSLVDAMHYLDCVTEWSFAIGWYVRLSAPPYNPASVFVTNDFDDPGWGLIDRYTLLVTQPYGPPRSVPRISTTFWSDCSTTGGRRSPTIRCRASCRTRRSSTAPPSPCSSRTRKFLASSRAS